MSEKYVRSATKQEAFYCQLEQSVRRNAPVNKCYGNNICEWLEKRTENLVCQTIYTGKLNQSHEMCVLDYAVEDSSDRLSSRFKFYKTYLAALRLLCDSSTPGRKVIINPELVHRERFTSLEINKFLYFYSFLELFVYKSLIYPHYIFIITTGRNHLYLPTSTKMCALFHFGFYV